MLLSYILMARDAPGGHSVHCSADAKPVAMLKVPSLHGSGADAPRGQYEPPSHERKSEARDEGW